jgi:(4S)-4-hydroxy-5-phosphonooxypentane-2,3-dione isomerase
VFVVTVDIQVHPAHIANFMPEMLANAQASLSLEPECHQFDVCQSANDPGHIFLYEIYTSQEAFKAHLTQAHFLKFDAVSQPWIAQKNVQAFQRLS